MRTFSHLTESTSISRADSALITAVILCCTIGIAHGGNLAIDGSLTLGNPATTVYRPGTQADNPIIWSRGSCTNAPLWQLVPDPWGVNSSATGSLSMTYTGSGSVVTKVDLDNLAVAAVNGYPFIFYGHDIYGNHMDGQPPKFPAQLKAMRSLTVDLNYTLAVEKAPANLNIAFDQRLMPASTYASGASGSLEVMVALYFNFSWGAAGHFVQTVTVPVTVNGVQSPVVFNVYMTGWGPGNLVVIYPQDSQFTSGDIRFDMLPLLKTAAAVAGIDQTWYVPGLMFGTEFGASKTAKYTFTVNKFSFEQQ